MGRLETYFVVAYRNGRKRATTAEDSEAIVEAIANPAVFLSMAYQKIRKQKDRPNRNECNPKDLLSWCGRQFGG